MKSETIAIVRSDAMPKLAEYVIKCSCRYLHEQRSSVAASSGRSTSTRKPPGNMHWGLLVISLCFADYRVTRPVAVPSMLDGIAPAIAVAVEERHLLRAVRGIIGRVEVDGDQSGTVA